MRQHSFMVPAVDQPFARASAFLRPPSPSRAHKGSASGKDGAKQSSRPDGARHLASRPSSEIGRPPGSVATGSRIGSPFRSLRASNTVDSAEFGFFGIAVSPRKPSPKHGRPRASRPANTQYRCSRKHSPHRVGPNISQIDPILSAVALGRRSSEPGPVSPHLMSYLGKEIERRHSYRCAPKTLTFAANRSWKMGSPMPTGAAFSGSGD